MQRRTPHLLEPKRSVLAGLVKFLAVGCGLNEFAPLRSSLPAARISAGDALRGQGSAREPRAGTEGSDP